MAEENFQEKTEKATPKKLREVRKKGQVAQSKEVTTVLVLFSSLCVLFFSASWILLNLTRFMGGFLKKIGTLNYRQCVSLPLLIEAFQSVLIILMPIMIVVMIAGVAGNLLQFGFMYSSEPLIPKLSKLDPIKGMKKLFSLKSLVELVKMVFKVFLVGYIAFLVIKSELDIVPSLVEMDLRDVISFIASMSFNIWLYACLALLLLALMDYLYQRWQFEKDNKMSKQEVKDESKRSEGDPSVKARIRNIQREMSQRRMMDKIPEADVIITNPTSLAVALQFDSKKMIAPCVLAKGSDFIAEKIKTIARENEIPIVEDKPLAQVLYKVVEIGEFIPENLYRAVAEVLAYIYRLKSMRNRV